MPTLQDIRESEYMSLAEGVGIVPERFRNRGYDKLDFEPGEGGAIAAPTSTPAAPSGLSLESFLAGVAAGANPQEFAKELLGGNAAAKPRRRRAAAPAAATDTDTPSLTDE